MPMDPYPPGMRVYYLEGGKARVGTVQATETIEGMRYVVIKLDDNSPLPVKIPINSVSKLG